MDYILETLAPLESSAHHRGGVKRKRRQKNPKIAEVIRRLHNSNSNKSRLCSPHNTEVTSVLVKTLQASPDFYGVDSDAFVSACKTYYETVRRNFRYSQPGLADKATVVRSSARCRSRRKRLLEKRQSILVGEEAAFWEGVTIDLMSDEEDGIFEGESGWIVRPPSFRSQELSDLCSTLQMRLEANPKYSAMHHKRLYVGPCSDRKPPPHGSKVDKHYIS
ncbi:uncharacterized protein C14orf93 [Austrofundulus limnaeus]|uniref:Uncharacterized protein C14orf93 n=1 Tax=Austrofundulus limnaeus TaxID=52670 RepID=A0A2I4BPB6_AUSLI|nr:PREDICTED: uncharacterized protein C14orf93 homolog [Austrofundulus limnaeus]